jgi:DNA polymerase-3 subunit delta
MNAPESKLKGTHILIAGSDEYRIKERMASLMLELAPEDPMNLETIDGQVPLVDQVVAQIDSVRAAMLTLPFFGGRKVVHLKNATFLADTRESRSEAVQEALAKLLETVKSCPPAEVQLVISALGVDRRRTFYKQFEKLAHLEAYDLVDLRGRGGEEACLAEIERVLEAHELTTEPGVVEQLLELIGNDTRALHSEVEKLAIYVYPGKQVTMKDVRKIVAATRELLAWDLCDAVAMGKVKDSVQLLRQLMAQGEQEIGILAMLSNHFRLMAVTAALAETGDLKLKGAGPFPGVTMSDLAKEILPKTKAGELPKPFRLARVMSQSQKRSRAACFRAVETVYQTYWKALSGGTDRARSLESGVVELCRLV